MSDQHPEEERIGERYQRLEAERQARMRRFRNIGAVIIAVVFAGAVVAIALRSSEPEPAKTPAIARAFKPVDDYFTRSSKFFPSYDVIDTVAGVAVLASDLRTDLNETFGRVDNLPDSAEREAVDRIKSRILMARRAIDIGMSDDPDFQAAMRRYYISTLAGRYLNWKLTPAIEVTRAEVEAYIADNPQLFTGRRRFSFDAVDVPVSAYSSLESDIVRRAKSIDEILVLVKGLGLPFRRRPFAMYSEEMPTQLLAVMDRVINDKETVFLKLSDQATIMRLLAVDPAPVPADERYSLALSRVTAVKRAEAIAAVEAEILADLLQANSPEAQRPQQPISEGGAAPGANPQP